MTGTAPYKNRTKDFFESLLWRDGKRFVVDFSREVSNFLEMYRVKVGLAQNENCSSQITKDAFSTTEGSNRAEPLK